MTQSDDTPVQPALANLMASYLRNKAEDQVAGLAPAEVGGEVTPFEAAPVQIVDPRLAWEEAAAVVRYLEPAKDSQTWKVPPDWPLLVSAQEPAAALAFSLGNYPQMVRHLQPLLQGGKVSQLRPSGGRPIQSPDLVNWAAEVGRDRCFPQVLLAAGALRLARHFDSAEALLQENRKSVPRQWQPALANEEAALAWHRGEAEQALRLWQAQAESVPVLFNRGMAALFLDRPAEAHNSLGQAVARLPESGAWHHLGRLYLALAETR